MFVDGFQVGDVGQSGMVAFLERSPRRARAVVGDDTLVRFEDGWKRALVSLDRCIDDPDALRHAAFDVLERALDVRTLSDRFAVNAAGTDRSVLLWSYSAGKLCVTIYSRVAQGVRTDVSWELTRAKDGSVESSEDEPDAPWHVAQRFIRHSIGARDVFDAYRNAYLAIESFLDGFAPREDRERETDWLKRGLKALAQDGLDLGLYTKGDPSPGTWMNEQYEAIRCAVFHAKGSAGPLHPGNASDRETVSVAYESLQRLLLDVSRMLGHGPEGSGVMTYGGMQFMTERWVGDGVDFGTTGDSTEASVDDVDLAVDGLSAEHWVGAAWSGSHHLRRDNFRFRSSQEVDPGFCVGRIGLRARSAEESALMMVDNLGELKFTEETMLGSITDWGCWNTGLLRNPFAL